MKKIIMTIGLLISLAAFSNAQGIRVTYLEQIRASDNVKELSPEMRAAVEAQLKQQNRTMCLYSFQGESVYSPIQINSATQPQQGSLNIQTMRMGGGATIYKNQNDKQIISQEYILDKLFLITEGLNAPIWNMSAEEKTIGSLKCKKATNAGGDIAWYCPDIPVNEGPGTYFGLPGLIIKLETQARTIVVQDIDLKYDALKDIKKPNSGKKITREDFNNTRTKKMQEMGINSGGPGVKVIKM
ncbi:MAG: GLPGLI family protein [Bacteroides sp.]|uniref:GLPGLI family protein n=1 Tax=Bacteroides sp. TaxID=29523 RepID=UPI002FCC1513